MAFYDPISLQIENIHVIVYLDEGIEKILDRSTKAIEDHIKPLQDMLDNKQEIDYQIIILWNEDNDIMTDMWTFTKTGEWGSGPLTDVKIFRGKTEVNDIGVGSGNTLIMLGKEEEHRRKSPNIDDYLTKTRPELPKYLLLNQKFEADGNQN